MSSIKIFVSIILILIFWNISGFTQSQNKGLIPNDDDVIDLGSQLELFTDSNLIANMDNVQFQLHEPENKGPVLYFDKPWEGPFSAYCTVIKTADKYQMYYRGLYSAEQVDREDETTCYAESDDGVVWSKPNLKIFERNGNLNNNIVLAKGSAATHNFSPFLDSRENIDPQQKFKALGGSEKSGLIAYVSADGIHWKKLQDEPVFRKGKFDSQNVAFWSESEQRYLCYFRTWTSKAHGGFRTVSRTTSPDFINWTEPVEMSYGNTPPEHIYVNQTAPYFRAPHIYISTAARFMPGRQVLNDEQAKKVGVNPAYFKDCSDVVLMTSRGGNLYDRTFMEGFINPGLGLQNWVSRANYPVLNIVQTGPTEMSLYVNKDYAQPTAHINRYVLRLDGFISVNAPYEGGELLTKPFRFWGENLLLNFTTSAAGAIKVEVLDGRNQPITGLTLEESQEIIGNEIEKIVSWKNGNNVGFLSGKTIRLRFVMKDAHLYSIRFK